MDKTLKKMLKKVKKNKNMINKLKVFMYHICIHIIIILKKSLTLRGRCHFPSKEETYMTYFLSKKYFSVYYSFKA